MGRWTVPDGGVPKVGPPDEVDGTEARLQRLIQMIIDFAVDALGADGATLTIGEREIYSTVKTSDSRLVHIDEAQYEAKDGPCIQALLQNDEPIVVDDFSEDERWQHVADLATQLGIHSSLSVGVSIDHDQALGASLNFYSREQRHFAEEQIRSGQLLAAQLGTAISTAELHRATARLAHELANALRSRAVIDQAKGMLMRERRCTADDAFDILRKTSQNKNVRLAEVAARLVAAAQRSGSIDPDGVL